LECNNVLDWYKGTIVDAGETAPWCRLGENRVVVGVWMAKLKTHGSTRDG